MPCSPLCEDTPVAPQGRPSCGVHLHTPSKHPSLSAPNTHTGLPPPPLILSLFFPVAPLTLMGDALVELAHGSIHAFPQDSLFDPFFNVSL